MSKTPSNIVDADLPVSFGRYELLEIVGQGGMGRVFRARLNGPAGFQKEVAVKVIIGGAETIPVHKRNQLAHEARLGGLLRHPNIVDTYELGDNDDGMFIAMELVDGISLSKLIAREKGLPVACSLDVLLQVTAALDHAHNLNINGSITPMIHRDLKPGNLLIDRAGMVKVTDFGISMLHMQGAVHLVPQSVQGTLRYMSPEQVTGAELGVQSDLFSLGIIAYEMLTGRRLFPKGHPHETADRILLEEIKFKQSGRFQRVEALQPGLGAVILSCLRQHPANRIQSAALLFEQLRALRIQSPGESLPLVLPRHIAGARMLHMSLMPMGGGQTNPLSVSAETAPDGLSITASPNTNIPTERPPLFGRSELLKQIHRQFKKKAKIVTLKGPGGIGKTSVALRFIQDRLDEFPGGTWIFDLTPARDLRGIIQIIAKELDLPLGKGDLATCIEQVGRCIAGRGESLLLLDNVEQVAKHMPQILSDWASQAPRARFITTSRERLHAEGERILEVEPLDPNESLALFRVRARKDDGSSPPSKALAKQIIPHLEGNPLAIELAAARSREMGTEALLEGLSERFLLISSERNRPLRQATLRATIDWSWNLLKPWEQSTLAQLSIFRGGFTMEAAEEILNLDHYANAPWLIDILQSLLDSSLLRAKPREDQPRFVLNESIRQYASEKLDVDRTELEVRLLSHFAAYGTPKYQIILRRGGAPARRMLAELENLVHAFDLAILNQHPLALPCFIAVYDAFEKLGPISRVQSLSQQVLDLNLSPEEAAAVALKSCFAHIVGGQLDQAKNRIDTARLTAEQWQNNALHAEALFLQATVQLQEGEINNAIESGTEAISMADQANAPRLEALSHGIVGRAHRMAGDYQRAANAYKTATDLSRHMGDQSLLASYLGDEGTIAMMQGRLTDAVKRYGQSLAVAANTGDRRIQAVRTLQLGTALLEAGELNSALKDYATARKMFSEFGEHFNEAMALVGISQVHYVQENYPEARALLFECLDLLKEVGSERHAGIALTNLGEIEIAMEDYSNAETHLNDAIRVSESFGMARISAAAHSTLGLLYLRKGQHFKSGEALKVAEDSLRGINEPVELGKLLCNKAELFIALGQREQAIAIQKEVQDLSKAIKTTPESDLGRRIAAFNDHLKMNT